MILQIMLGIEPYSLPAGKARLYGPDIKRKPDPIPSGNNMVIKSAENRAKVLAAIQRRKSTATKLAKACGLARSTISNQTELLIADGLVECDKTTWPWQYFSVTPGKEKTK